MLNYNDIKNALVKGNFFLSKHIKQRCFERGISMCDIKSAIMNGKIIIIRSSFYEMWKLWLQDD